MTDHPITAERYFTTTVQQTGAEQEKQSCSHIETGVRERKEPTDVFWLRKKDKNMSSTLVESKSCSSSLPSKPTKKEKESYS